MLLLAITRDVPNTGCIVLALLGTVPVYVHGFWMCWVLFWHVTNFVKNRKRRRNQELRAFQSEALAACCGTALPGVFLGIAVLWNQIWKNGRNATQFMNFLLVIVAHQFSYIFKQKTAWFRMLLLQEMVRHQNLKHFLASVRTDKLNCLLFGRILQIIFKQYFKKYGITPTKPWATANAQ